MTDGTKANETGNVCEKLISSLLSRKKIVFTTHTYYGQSIYDTKLYADFILTNKNIIIESKWQQAGGSVDEKFPFLVANLKQSKFKSILIIDGGGQKKGAMLWLKDQVDDKLIGVFTISEFIGFVNNGGLN